jgi:hypothetical protein
VADNMRNAIFRKGDAVGEAAFAAIVARFCSCTRKAQGCLSVAVCKRIRRAICPAMFPGKRGVGRVFPGG